MEKALKFDLQEFVEKMKTKNVLPRENRPIFSSNRPRGYTARIQVRVKFKTRREREYTEIHKSFITSKQILTANASCV